MEFTPELAAIHAYLCADGYVIRNPSSQKNIYYYIGFRNFENTLLDDFELKFKQVFNTTPRRGKDGRCIVQNKSLYNTLTEKHCYYSKNWTIPQIQEKEIKYWLRAYFDCEGWVVCRIARDRHIGLDTINEIGAKYICKQLANKGISTKLKYRSSKRIWRLLIYGKENLIRFQKEINFLHPKKKQKLQKALDSYQKTKWGPEYLNKQLKKLSRHNKRARVSSIYVANIDRIERVLKRFNIHYTITIEQNKRSKYRVLYINKNKEKIKLRKSLKRAQDHFH